MKRVTRRGALAEGLLAFGALALAGCGGGTRSTGSTLEHTWIDPAGTGQLQPGPGEPLIDRLELAPRAALSGELVTLVHLTDAHVLDASSPARVTFLDRLGPPFQSTFRPQEALTVQVLAGMSAAIRSLRPALVIQGGDLIDNDQHNELEQALAALRGGRVRPGSGPHGYYGVQSPFDPDPFYYRPDVDAPQHPGLLRDAVQPFAGPGVGAPSYPVLGDHDVLVAGEVAPTTLTRALAVGDRALWELPPDLTLPAGLRSRALSSPDGPPNPGQVDAFLQRALAGPTVNVPPDRERAELSVDQVIARLTGATGTSAVSVGDGRLDYTLDVGAHLRLIVLDLARREGGSGGAVSGEQPAFVERALDSAGERWIVVISHQPLVSSTGGDQILALMDRAPRVIAALNGHTHRNRIEPRRTQARGYWLITTASLIDFPQQARALRLRRTAAGGIAIQTWMLDHAYPGPLGTTSRQLSYLDAHGGRPAGFAGSHRDRNVTLYVR